MTNTRSESDSAAEARPVPMSPAEEEKLIDDSFQEVLTGYLRSNHRKKVEIIERAFKFAKKAHQGIRRRSGEPYILHPIAVARIVNREIGLGSTSICAALLHDVVEDTDYTVEDIEQHFGPKIAQLVAGLTKISGGIFGDKASLQAENFRHLLLTMSEDIRVVLIKMADRLHNMRTLSSMAPNKQYKIAGETLYIYAPLAHRLGLFSIKTELEDLSFKYEHPQQYDEIARQVRESEEKRNSVYSDFSEPILRALDKMGLQYEAKARMKSIYSIWRKMETKHIPFSDVYDLYAMRIIFDCDDPSQEKTMCMNIYSAITDLYDPHPDRFRDWVSVPKANGYQALHVTVMGPDGNWVEVQIRSRRMDEIAEKGFAAHWKYKVGEHNDEESELNRWLQTIQDILENPTPNDLDFFDTLKLNLFAQEIGVFTPKGELLTLPVDSTILDVAYMLHSDLGDHCIAGKVNHKLVPLSYRLQSGDQVEVLTSGKQRPKAEWMKHLATAKARIRLGAALRREQRPVIEKGRAIVDDYFKRHELEPTNERIMKMMSYYKAANPDELYLRLGNGQISLDRYEVRERRKENSVTSAMRAVGQSATDASKTILRKILSFGGGKKEEKEEAGDGIPAESTPLPGAVQLPPIDPKKTYTLIAREGERNFILSGCCHPIPGDDVMGFITDDNQVELHELTCPRASVLKAGYGQRIVATRWDDVDSTFPTAVRIEGIDRQGILQELTYMISKHLNLDIRSLNITASDGVFTCELHVKVRDTEAVDSLCASIARIEGVKRACRIG